MVFIFIIVYIIYFDVYFFFFYEVFVVLLYWGIFCFVVGSMEICFVFGFVWLDCSLEDVFIDGWIVVEDFWLVLWSLEC